MCNESNGNIFIECVNIFCSRKFMVGGIIEVIIEINCGIVNMRVVIKCLIWERELVSVYCIYFRVIKLCLSYKFIGNRI